MLLDRPLQVVTPTVDGDVLAALARADQAFTPARLRAVVGRHSVAGIRNSLNRLVDQGLVLAERVGPSYSYRFNRDHLAATAVLELAVMRETLLARLSDEVADWQPSPVFAALFGSAAHGEMRPDSDIDLLLVRAGGAVESTGPGSGTSIDPTTSSSDERWQGQVSELAARVSRWTGNDCRVLEMSEAHVAAHGREEPVLADVCESGVVLAGDPQWLRRALRAPRGA